MSEWCVLGGGGGGGYYDSVPHAHAQNISQLDASKYPENRYVVLVKNHCSFYKTFPFILNLFTLKFTQNIGVVLMCLHGNWVRTRICPGKGQA